MSVEITEAILIAACSGLSCAVMTVAALKTDITWIKKEIERLEAGMIRAHNRIDEIDRDGCRYGVMHSRNNQP